MGSGMMDGMGYMGGWGWGGMAFGGLMMVLWFVLIVGLIVLVVRWIGGTIGRSSDQSALDILKQRYARGEIDAVELKKRTQQLMSTE